MLLLRFRLFYGKDKSVGVVFQGTVSEESFVGTDEMVKASRRRCLQNGR
jgi:hypothetical protein